MVKTVSLIYLDASKSFSASVSSDGGSTSITRFIPPGKYLIRKVNKSSIVIDYAYNIKGQKPKFFRVHNSILKLNGETYNLK